MIENTFGNCVCNLSALADDFPEWEGMIRNTKLRVMRRNYIIPRFFPFRWGRCVEVQSFDEHYDSHGWYTFAAFPESKLDTWLL
jgi:hypothetical protein